MRRFSIQRFRPGAPASCSARNGMRRGAERQRPRAGRAIRIRVDHNADRQGSGQGRGLPLPRGGLRGEGARFRTRPQCGLGEGADVDPGFKALEARLFSIYSSKERIPAPSIQNDVLRNFWTDAEHRARALAADDVRRLQEAEADVDHTARRRRARERREGELGLARGDLLLPAAQEVPHHALEGRR